MAHPKTIVIGGGLSGLTAAYRLHLAGAQVELYEARPRLGGRVLTVSVNGEMTELGGQNLSDGGHAPHLHQMIQEMGLEVEEQTSHVSIYLFENGKKVNITELIQNLNMTEEEIIEQLERIAHDADSMQEVIKQLFEHNAEIRRAVTSMLAGYEGSPSEKLSTTYIQTLFHILSGGLSAAHPKNGEYEQTAIEFEWIKGGNSLLPVRIGEKLGNKIFLEHQLTKIEKLPDGDYLLTFQNGKEVRADIVVCTLPCPLFNDIAFGKGVMEEERLSSIRSLENGTNGKILIPIPQGINAEATFLDDPLGVFNPASSKVQVMYYIKEHGKFDEETLEKTFQKGKPLVEAAYGFSPPAPTYATEVPFAHYETSVGYSWSNAPFSKGSYSFIPAGKEELFTRIIPYQNEQVKALFAPIEGSFFFAGEHTTIDLDITGTMEAAVESGERIARIIIEKLQAGTSLAISKE